MKLTTVATALVLGLVLASCNENEQPKPAARRNTLLDSIKQGQVTYSSNVANGSATPGNAIPGRQEVNIPGANLMPTPPAAPSHGKRQRSQRISRTRPPAASPRLRPPRPAP